MSAWLANCSTVLTTCQQMNMVHEMGKVETVEYRTDGTYVLARVPQALASRLERYNVVQKDPFPLTTVTEAVEESSGEDEIDWVALGRGRHNSRGKNSP